MFLPPFCKPVSTSESVILIHLVVCLTTGPKPLPKRALHIVRSRASSFKWEYPLLSLRSSNSFLRLIPCLPVTSIPPCIFPSITRCRRQFLRKIIILFSLNSCNPAALCQLIQWIAPLKHRLLFPLCIPNPPLRRIYWSLPDLLFPVLPKSWRIPGCRTAVRHTQNTGCLQQARSGNMVHVHTVRTAESTYSLQLRTGATSWSW